MSALRCLLIVGTRPEAIKLAPLYLHLAADPDRFAPTLLCTGQHDRICAEALGCFGLTPDLDLNGQVVNNGLLGFTSALLDAMGRVLEQHPADLVIVQGDTSSATGGALAAFYHGVPVAHVEAGLRSHDLMNPFPEEGNRRVIDTISSLLLAPTPAAADNLIAEGFSRERIAITGNTVVDALQLLARRGTAPFPPVGRRLVVVTTHRRESWGSELEEMCRAIVSIATRHEIEVAIPVHPNPRVRETVSRVLGAAPNVRLLPPLDYTSFLALLRQAHLVLTDSGGVQEEAPSLGVPVLVMRKTTERSEAIEAGMAKLVGTGYEAIVAAADALLGDNAAHAQMIGRRNPFGDGRACERIAAAILNWRSRRTPLLDPDAAFAADEPLVA